VTLGDRLARSYGRFVERVHERRQPSITSTVRYACPLCGGDHPPQDHELADGAGFRALDASGLRRLRAEALEELVHGLLDGAERHHLERVAQLVGRVDARLEQLDG
jgi:hypothetical protein